MYCSRELVIQVHGLLPLAVIPGSKTTFTMQKCRPCAIHKSLGIDESYNSVSKETQNLTNRSIAKFSSRVSLNYVLNTIIILYRWHFSTFKK